MTQSALIIVVHTSPNSQKKMTCILWIQVAIDFGPSTLLQQFQQFWGQVTLGHLGAFNLVKMPFGVMRKGSGYPSLGPKGPKCHNSCFLNTPRILPKSKASLPSYFEATHVFSD